MMFGRRPVARAAMAAVLAAMLNESFGGPPSLRNSGGRGRRFRRGAWRDESLVWYAQNGRPPVDAAALRAEHAASLAAT